MKEQIEKRFITDSNACFRALEEDGKKYLEGYAAVFESRSRLLSERGEIFYEKLIKSEKDFIKLLFNPEFPELYDNKSLTEAERASLKNILKCEIMTNKIFYSPKEVQEILGISAPTEIRWGRDGTLPEPFHTTKRKKYYRKEDIDLLILIKKTETTKSYGEKLRTHYQQLRRGQNQKSRL
jgi:predicted DNA-binding transcriptional regulator AlpA